MNMEIKTIHLELPEDYRDLIEKKAHKINFAQDMIVDLLLTITKGKDYAFDSTINFRWGTSHHISVNDFDLRDGIDKLFDKIDSKVTKEKNKIKEH